MTSLAAFCSSRRRGHPAAWLAVALGGLYFLAPLVATFEFSLRMRRGEYSFDAYRVVFASGNFQASFLYSTIVALVTIVVAALIVVPAAYFVQLRLPRLRGIVEFVTLLPLVIMGRGRRRDGGEVKRRLAFTRPPRPVGCQKIAFYPNSLLAGGTCLCG